MQQGTITRRMKSTKNEIYRNLLTVSDFAFKIEKLRSAQPSQRPSVCAELCEMFRALNIPCKTGADADYYTALAENADLPDFDRIEEKIMKSMYDSFGSFPTPAEYMLRIVNRLSDPADGWQEDTLRLRILKQFIKYGHSLTYQQEKTTVHIYSGESYLRKYVKAKTGKSVKGADGLIAVIGEIDDHVFDVLKTATKEQTKTDGTYGLLRLADDLAAGKFKAGGATKRDLYMFAFVYDMTYTVNQTEDALKSTELFSYETDIEKNLFEDYYANNLMRFLTEAYQNGKSSFESDPSGAGINYKNFAEMVYIYFIAKDGAPIEKLRKATEMIARLAHSGQTSQTHDTSTQYYNTIFTEEILSLSEAEFEAFIAANYDCRLEYEGIGKNNQTFVSIKAPIQVQNTQETAFRIYSDLIRDITQASEESPDRDTNYGLWFVDVPAFEKYSIRKLEKLLNRGDKTGGTRSDPEKIRDFVMLLCSINQYLAGQIGPGGKCNKKLAVTRAEDMTRTALIVAFYYRYNLMYELSGDHKSFAEVMDDYTDPDAGLNSLLEAAGYQPINDRNIFDLAVIFSSYAYLRL